MNEPTYKVDFDDNNGYFVFESVGQKGSILKVVVFTEIQEGVFNLAFGDYDIETKLIDDKSVSNNGDMKKVISTVVNITMKFLFENPTVYVYIEGSTTVRTRFYQRIIDRYYDNFNSVFELYGLRDGIPTFFQKNQSYESFLIKKLF
jgi:hypothetical protein